MTQPAQRQILLIGDSLTVACHDELMIAAADASVDLTIRAQIGRSMRAAHPILASTGHRSDVVIALGTNDCTAPKKVVDRAIDSVASTVRPGTQLWWIDLALTDGRDAAFNAALARAAQRHSTLEVVSWAEVVGVTPGLIRDDGVHLTSAGCAARADLLTHRIFRREEDIVDC